MKRIVCLACVAFAAAACAQAPALKGEFTSSIVEIKDGAVRLDCPLVFNLVVSGPRPGVLLIADHPLSPADRARAEQIAKWGYAVLVTDLAGPGARSLDRATAQRRLPLVFDAFSKQPQVAAHRVAAIGYGSGATHALEFARAGGELFGVACLHGDLSGLNKAAPRINGRVLALVGSEDPNCNLAAFEADMKSAHVDWDVIRYGGVGANFTDAKAPGYDADADARSNAAVKQFLSELFPPPGPRSFAAPRPATAPVAKAAPAGVPDSALQVLKNVDEHDGALDGYEGGRHFGNFERKLPATDRTGRRIRYREWDVNPLRAGTNRGPERLVTGSDGSAHYTDDHYNTFKKIR